MTESILSTIGHTPLVRLTRVLPDCPFRLFAKLEGFNPGGSAKDRPALHILQEAMRTGAIRAGTVVIESSSGNLGIGLAQACRYLGLRFICVVDPKTTAQNIRILKAYGAEIDLCPVRFEDADILRGGFRVHHADESQSQIAAGLRQADPQVPGTGLNHHGPGPDGAGSHCLLENMQRRPVFCAPTRIESFQLGEEAEWAVWEHAR